MIWTRRHTLLAGIALIALTNAIALGGAAWNRGGEPESVLTLSQRELWAPHGSWLDRDGGGLELRLRWRVLTADPAGSFYADMHGAPEWLDEAKLAALGFDVTPPPAVRRAGRRYDRQLPKDAMIVLELDGAARKRALERAKERAKQEAAKAAETGRHGPGNPAQQAALLLKNEETANSRLFAVDAGPDAGALRAKYPDRNRYAIVQGKVRPYYQGGRGNDARWRGTIEVIENARVNVPIELRQALGAAQVARSWGPVVQGDAPFEVTIAFGKRFEPWILAAGKNKQ